MSDLQLVGLIPLHYFVQLLPFFLIVLDARSENISPVIRIIDGDITEVLHNQHPERIRISGIDCPEKGQAYGMRAKHAASDLAFGKEVTAQTHGHDKYKRTIGDVILPDGTNVNHTLVKEGWCWWYPKYAPGDMVLEGLEAEAREGRKGLWADPKPVPPGSGGRSDCRRGREVARVRWPRSQNSVVQSIKLFRTMIL